ncbi:MAG: polysaccharide deacetylase family protein [Candidatus Methylacidiphilales bacterium]
MDRERPRVLLSFDVEEFDIPAEFGRMIGDDDQVAVGAKGLERVLMVLERTGVVATLFCTVRFAQACPELIRNAVQRHELGSHGWQHDRLNVEDLMRSREALEHQFGVPVLGFRPARFQPVPAKAVRSAGYQYHSSENPIWLPGRYNHWNKPRTVYRQDGLVQIPISASPVLRFPLFWLAAKNYPEGIFRALTQWTLRRDGYVNLFFHPWELCEVGDWGLPFLVRARDGMKMSQWLERQIRWLQECAEFETLGAFAARYREGDQE